MLVCYWSTLCGEIWWKLGGSVMVYIHWINYHRPFGMELPPTPWLSNSVWMLIFLIHCNALLPNSDDEDFQLAFVTLDFCRPLVVVTLDCPRLPRCLLLQRQYRSTKEKAHKCQMRPMRFKKKDKTIPWEREEKGKIWAGRQNQSAGEKKLQSQFQNAAPGHIITL